MSVFSQLDQRYGIKSATSFLQWYLGLIKKEDLNLLLLNKYRLPENDIVQIANQFSALASRLPAVVVEEEIEEQPITNKNVSSNQNMAIKNNFAFDPEDEMEVSKFKNVKSDGSNYNYDDTPLILNMIA